MGHYRSKIARAVSAYDRSRRKRRIPADANTERLRRLRAEVEAEGRVYRHGEVDRILRDKINDPIIWFLADFDPARLETIREMNYHDAIVAFERLLLRSSST
jgi:hypothetical protein